jgi:hypothetical protein
LLLVLSPAAKGQANDYPFFDGEEITYELVYQWGFIWAKAGKATFTAKDTLVDGQSLWHFEGFGTSYSHWDWFYEVRSTYESLADENLQSLEFKRHGHEGSTIYDRVYTVAEDSIRYVIDEDKKGGDPKTGSLPYRSDAFDVVTAIYHCRNLDFSDIAADETLPLTFYLDGNYYDSYLRYKGQERWEDPRTEKVYDCDVFTPSLIKGTIFKEGERMTVYVTRDEQRVPVYIETELRVGKARVYLLED